MHKKIYFGAKPLFLCSQITPDLDEYLHHDDAVFIDEFNIHTVKTMIHEMIRPAVHAGIFLHNDLNALLNAFKKKLFNIEAAGGFIYTDKKEILFIYRRGKWDLPKGKIDAGEKPETTALREVEEETGVKNSKIIRALSPTYHTYSENNRLVLKETHWYLMHTSTGQTFSPQIDEDIEKCEWVPIEKFAAYLENTHSSIIDVANEGVKHL